MCLCKSRHSPNILACLLCIHSTQINQPQPVNARPRFKSHQNQFCLHLQTKLVATQILLWQANNTFSWQLLHYKPNLLLSYPFTSLSFTKIHSLYLALLYTGCLAQRSEMTGEARDLHQNCQISC